MKPGDYRLFGGMVKHLFMHPAVTVLEEYGLPYKLTLQVLQKHDLGDDVDAIIANLHRVDLTKLSLTHFESEMLRDTIDNL
jgi:hypothetical protein